MLRKELAFPLLGEEKEGACLEDCSLCKFMLPFKSLLSKPVICIHGYRYKYGLLDRGYYYARYGYRYGYGSWYMDIDTDTDC